MADLTGHVHATLAKHYPQHVLGWVKQATWTRDPAVPLSRIDMSRRPGGRDPQKVAGIAKAVTDGKPMPPVVLVDTGEDKLQIADGYHRTLGFQHAGKTKIPALIASGVGAHGPWEKRMHDAKLNLTAEHAHVFDLAGTCTGPGPCDTSSFGAGKNWVNKVGGLPDYIRAVAHAFRRKGLSESEAIQRAVGVVRNWAEGKGNVSAATRARAAAAIAEWEAKKAASHTLTASPAKHTLELGEALAAGLLDLAWSEQAHPRGGKGTAAGGKFVAKNAAPGATLTPAGMTGNVRDFQRRMGLPVTGVIDSATAAAIARETAAKGGAGGKGKHKGKHKKPRKVTATVAAARARSAQRRTVGQHIAAVNSLSVAQRTEARRRMPVPPTGYVWGKDNTLRAVKMTRAQQTAPLTGI